MSYSAFQTKTKQLIDKFKSGDIKSAIKILSGFRIGITKEQRRVLEIAKDCNSGNASFYKQIGIDTEFIMNEAKHILENYINKQLSWRMN